MALADLVGTASGVTLKVTRNKLADLYASQYMFRDATVEARAGKKLLATFRVVEISGFGNPDSPTGGWDPIAVHWIRLVTDKDATARAKAGTLPTPPAIADAVAVPTGAVSFVTSNMGWRTHELVVLPLADGATVGRRVPGGDGRIDEADSAGEASAGCAAGAFLDRNGINAF